VELLAFMSEKKRHARRWPRRRRYGSGWAQACEMWGYAAPIASIHGHRGRDILGRTEALSPLFGASVSGIERRGQERILAKLLNYIDQFNNNNWHGME
jgi:hypothetical protein